MVDLKPESSNPQGSSLSGEAVEQPGLSDRGGTGTPRTSNDLFSAGQIKDLLNFILEGQRRHEREVRDCLAQHEGVVRSLLTHAEPQKKAEQGKASIASSSADQDAIAKAAAEKAVEQFAARLQPDLNGGEAANGPQRLGTNQTLGTQSQFASAFTHSSERVLNSNVENEDDEEAMDKTPNREEPVFHGRDGMSSGINRGTSHYGESMPLSSRRAPPWMVKVVCSHYFDMAVALVIFVNTISIGAQTDWKAQNIGEDDPAWWNALEWIFLVLFILELAMRACVENTDFFSGPNAKWNMFDSLVISFFIVELTVSNSALNQQRGVRVIRLVRVFRIIRVMRFLHDLRKMISGIMGTLMSLFWAMVLLLGVMYVFGVVITEKVIDMREHGEYGKEVDGVTLADSYGSLSITLYSLFKSISGGVDWGVLCDPLVEENAIWGMVFALYISFAVFCVLNIVTAVFVDHANQICHDEDLRNHKKFLLELRKVFMKADADGCGNLDYQEFANYLEDEQVQSYFRKLDLDVDTIGPRNLFNLLDAEDNGQIDADTFLHGVLKLKGSARSFDMFRLHREVTEMDIKMTYLMKRDELKMGGGQMGNRSSSRMTMTQLGQAISDIEKSLGQTPQRHSIHPLRRGDSYYTQKDADPTPALNRKSVSWGAKLGDSKHSSDAAGGDAEGGALSDRGEDTQYASSPSLTGPEDTKMADAAVASGNPHLMRKKKKAKAKKDPKKERVSLMEPDDMVENESPSQPSAPSTEPASPR